MEQVVYGDVLFIINFSMDFLSLYICGRIMHKKCRTLPMIVGAALGAAYSVWSLFAQMPDIGLFVIDIAVSALMCFAAFDFPPKKNKLSFKGFVSLWLVFFLCEMLLGGTFTALYNLINKTNAVKRISVGDVNSSYSEIPLWMFVIIAGLSAALTFAAGKLFGRKVKEKSVTLKIINEGNTISVKALVDSGNLLKEPISSKPVVIVGFEKIKNLLPREVREYIIYGDYEKISELSYKNAKKIRIIPMQSIGKSSVITGFVPDKMIIENGGRKYETDAVIGIEKEGNGYGDCEAVLPAELIT